MSRPKKHKSADSSAPRIIISALKGSGAKTIVSLGLVLAFKNKGLTVKPFKKGPDYIDAAWLSKAADEKCRHLDVFLMGDQGVHDIFHKHSLGGDVSLVEGNRGLFDGVDIYGTYSTAKIASLLQIPVILIVDCTKTTNTIAALVSGMQNFDTSVPFGGVILNHVSGRRHGKIISQSIEYHTGLPVLGIIPSLDIEMPERHLGLTPVSENTDLENTFAALQDIAEKYLDLNRISEFAQNAGPVPVMEGKADDQGNKETLRQSPHYNYARYPEPDDTDAGMLEEKNQQTQQKIKAGIIRDEAFQFYYEANLEALQEAGAEIIEFNSMTDKEISGIDLLYIGGGFPEVHAEAISKNVELRESIKKLAESGVPIYGECGAVIYLGKNVYYKGKTYDMCGVFPLEFELKQKPAGHGYAKITVDRKNPFFPAGTDFKGHEFHYSYVKNWDPSRSASAFQVSKGHGFDGMRDGIFYKNVFAAYTHIHAAGEKNWAKGLINCAVRNKPA